MLKQILRITTWVALLFSFVAVQNSYAQEEQRVLHLTFEEDVDDQSELNNQVSDFGSPEFSNDAIIGSNSIYFDGSDDYVEVEGSNVALGAFTVDFFFKPDSVNGATWIINKWGEQNPDDEENYFGRTNYGIIIHNPNGVIGGVEWDLGANNGNGGPTGANQRSGNLDGESTLEVGVWYNAIFVANADTSFFQLRDTDGNILGEGGYEPVGEFAVNPDQPLRLAWAGVDPNVQTPRFYNGYMDDLIIYNYARIDSEGNYMDPREEDVANEFDPTLPSEINLSQNYPNPFNPSTNIKYSIPNSGFVNLTVYDVVGKEVAVLVNGSQSAGTHTVTFNAESIPSGIYYYRLETEAGKVVKSMTLIK